MRWTSVTCPPASTEIMGAARDGAWPEMQIRQIVEDAGADCPVQKCCVVRGATSSQLSRACAIVVINSKPMHKEAHAARNLRNAADRREPLVICREMNDAGSRTILRMYHYPTQNGIPKVMSGSDSGFCHASHENCCGSEGAVYCS